MGPRSLGTVAAALAFVALLGGWTGVAAAATLPTGAWTCQKAATSQGPDPDQDRGSGAGEALVERLQILDGAHYVLSSQDEGAAQPSDAGVYAIEGDQMVGRTGPLAQVPMHARIQAAGPNGKPAVVFDWASAPTLSMICQPGS